MPGPCRFSVFTPLLVLLIFSCSRPGIQNDTIPQAAMATGDTLAIRLAKDIVNAAGGMENWQAIRHIGFDFFGSRTWYWDKHQNRYRVESEKRNYRISGNLDGSKTFLWLNGEVIIHPDSLNKYKEHAYKAWINDTYWLILPFKLLDPGVHLTFTGSCMADSITPAACFEMTFDQVGVTPENKYRIYADTVLDRIIRWDYFANQSDTIPSMSTPWTNYRSYGTVMMASGRGQRNFSGIQLFESLPDRLFMDVTLPASELLN